MARATRAIGGNLILGGGYAGSYVARKLGRRGATIVSPENYMLFTPLLPEAASGTLEPRHTVVPLRQMCPRSELVLGRATEIDFDRREVAADTEEGLLRIGYDQLVIALGSISRVLPIPGLAEHAFGFRDLGDAIHLRNHVLRRLEVASVAQTEAHRLRELTFVFVGAGYAGVEALAELQDMVRAAMRFYPGLRGRPQRWVLVDAAPKILPEVPSRLGDYAARLLERRGVEILVGTTLERAEAHAAYLSTGDRVLTSTLVWTAGVRARPLLERLGLPVDDRGRVRVDETLRVEGSSNVWALGDGARVPNAAEDGRPDPPTSQHALRQARRLARNLKGPPRPYRYRTLGQAATLGRYRGVAYVLGVPLRGFVGWFFTRTYHLYQLPLLSRKLRVVTDWTVALFFPRDVAELGVLAEQRKLGGD